MSFFSEQSLLLHEPGHLPCLCLSLSRDAHGGMSHMGWSLSGSRRRCLTVGLPAHCKHFFLCPLNRGADVCSQGKWTPASLGTFFSILDVCPPPCTHLRLFGSVGHILPFHPSPSAVAPCVCGATSFILILDWSLWKSCLPSFFSLDAYFSALLHSVSDSAIQTLAGSWLTSMWLHLYLCRPGTSCQWLAS